MLSRRWRLFSSVGYYYPKQMRREVFEFHLKERDFRCESFQKWASGASYKSLSNSLGTWMANLHKQTAVLVADDHIGIHVSQCCRQYDIRIPDHIALLGVGNDLGLAVYADPPLTSIELPGKAIAMEALEDPGVRIHVRISTD